MQNFGVTKEEHYGTAVRYGIFWSGQLCWYSGTSIYLKVLGIVNDFVYLSNSKIIYMEKNLTEFKDCFYRGIRAAEEMRTLFFQDFIPLLATTKNRDFGYEYF